MSEPYRHVIFTETATITGGQTLPEPHKPEPPPKPCCGRCRFAYPIDPDENIWFCCRYPPVPAQSSDIDGIQTWHPEVKTDGWCGEFQSGKHPHVP